MTSYAAPLQDFSWKQTLRIYGAETKCEFLKALRLPAYVIPTLTFPLVFYVMFGIVFGGKQALGSVTVAGYFLASYGAFGVIGASMFGFGVGVAAERGYGWLQLKRATPMPPLAYFAAKTIMSMLFSTILVLALFTLGYTLGGVRLPFTTWVNLGAMLVVGAIPFCALGLVIGYFAGPSSAPAQVNLLYLPMAFCSGLWIPLQFLPSALQHAAPYLPPYHLAQLALGIISREPFGRAAFQHLAALTAFTVLFLLLARLGYNRDDVKMYG
ncbi:MAG TPA: ABC transporter permease [Candidatus Angelobacter sp.]